MGDADKLLAQLSAALEAGDAHSARSSLVAIASLIVPARDLEAEARRNDLGVLTSELAHELRQPLLGVRAFAQFLDNDKETESARKLAGQILEQATRMETLITRVQRYAKGDSTDQPLTACDVNEAARDAAALLRPVLGKRRIRYREDLADALPLATAEPIGLQQIFINLLRNAIEAIGEEGEVTVHTTQTDGRVVATVSDSGPGILEAVRAELFDPYVSGGNGMGIGLHLSRNIARRAGGDLVLLEGEGARFELHLPVAVKAPDSEIP